MHFKSAKFVLEGRCIIIVTPIYSAIVTAAINRLQVIYIDVHTGL